MLSEVPNSSLKSWMVASMESAMAAIRSVALRPSTAFWAWSPAAAM